MTETLTRNGTTVEGLLDRLTAHGLEWCPDGFDAWQGRCPTCRGNCLSIRIDESGGFEIECPCKDCTPDGIVDAVFAPPKPEPGPETEPPVVAPPVFGSPPLSEPSSLESEGHVGLESHGIHETPEVHRTPETHATLGLPLEAIKRAIAETLPAEPKVAKKRDPKPLGVNSVAWPFARHLKSIPELRSLEMSEQPEALETAAANWHETASGMFQDPRLLPEKDRFVEEVIVCFGDVKTGIEESRLYVATVRARSSPYSDSKLTPPQQVIAAVCRNLGELNGDGEFFLSEQGAADAANAAKRSGTAALRKLVMLHLIEVIRKGTNDKGVKGERPKRQATLYRWIGPVENAT